MRIIYWLNSLDMGGTAKTAQLFGTYLNKDKFSIKTFTYQDADLSRIKLFQKFGDVEFIDRKNPNWSLLNDCDIVHSFRSGYKEIPEPCEQINVQNFIETNIFGFYDPNPKISKSIFMSKWLMDYCSNNIGQQISRFDYIYNPIEEPITNEKYHIECKRGAIILGRNGRQDDGVYDEINVLAAKQLIDMGYNIHFAVMACPKAMYRDLVKYNIPHSLFDASVDPYKLSMFYNAIDIYTEGRPDGHTCGCVLQEALVHKKPVIAHRAVPKYHGMGVFAAQYDVVQDGITGFVVDYDPLKYSLAIVKLINDKFLYEEMSKNAYSDAMNRFHINVGIKKLESIYDELCS